MFYVLICFLYAALLKAVGLSGEKCAGCSMPYCVCIAFRPLRVEMAGDELEDCATGKQMPLREGVGRWLGMD